MADQELINIDDLPEPTIPITSQKWIDYILKERIEALQRLAQQSRKMKTFPDITEESTKIQYQRVRMLLQMMTKYLQMTPEINAKTNIDKYLRLLVMKEEFHFPKRDIDEATRLTTRWESEKFGANEVQEEENAEQEGIDGEDEPDENGELWPNDEESLLHER